MEQEKDIVARLMELHQRAIAPPRFVPAAFPLPTKSIYGDAADEIERLRVAVDEAHREGWKAAKLALKEDGAPRLTVVGTGRGSDGVN